MDMKQNQPAEPPDREVLFSPIDEHGVDRTEAPEGLYAVYYKGWDRPPGLRDAGNCAECALYHLAPNCVLYPCEAKHRKDGKPVIFKALGT